MSFPQSRTSFFNAAEASDVIDALSANDANVTLQDGGKLLSVVVKTHSNGQLHPCYVLGKSEEQPHANESETTAK
jgi:hypothetical protein